MIMGMIVNKICVVSISQACLLKNDWSSIQVLLGLAFTLGRIPAQQHSISWEATEDLSAIPACCGSVMDE